MIRSITREESRAKMDRGEDFVLVDALGAEHYESSHLPGAINLPYEYVDEAERVLPDKGVEIVVYCMSTFAPPLAKKRANWRRWATRTSRTTPRASKTG